MLSLWRRKVVAETSERRRLAILEDLATARVVSVAQLSHRLGVSAVSVRSDLENLETRGLLRRIRGGAVSVPQTILEWSFTEKMAMHREQKERIGRAAAALVQNGDVVIMDSGTTVLQVARHISQAILTSGQLTVLTSSLPIARELGAWKGVHLILLGGVYLPEQEVVVGPQALATLAQLHASKMFLGAGGISLDGGPTTATVLDAEVDRASVRASDSVIAVVDSSKIGRKGLARVVPITELDMLITDTGAPAEFVAKTKALGLDVRLV